VLQDTWQVQKQILIRLLELQCDDSTLGSVSFCSRVEIRIAAPVAGGEALTYRVIVQCDESTEHFGGLLQLSATSCRRTRM
jgi:hypothetical protein